MSDQTFTKAPRKTWDQTARQHARQHKAEPGTCAYCDQERDLRNDQHPSHDASPRCQSGRRSHCSCDTCF